MLYIMRHGRTDWNDKGKLQGRTDVPLNADGRAMAEQAAKTCAETHFDVCFCSPLRRAKETAEILLRGRDVPILTDGRLTEMGFGVYEGMENGSMPPDCPVRTLFRDPENYRPDGGAESLSALYGRTGEFLRQAVFPLLEQGKDVLLVGHGAMNASIVCRVRGIPVGQFWSAGLEQCKLLRLL